MRQDTVDSSQRPGSSTEESFCPGVPKRTPRGVCTLPSCSLPVDLVGESVYWAVGNDKPPWLSAVIRFLRNPRIRNRTSSLSAATRKS